MRHGFVSVRRIGADRVAVQSDADMTASQLQLGSSTLLAPVVDGGLVGALLELIPVRHILKLRLIK